MKQKTPLRRGTPLRRSAVPSASQDRRAPLRAPAVVAEIKRQADEAYERDPGRPLDAKTAETIRRLLGPPRGDRQDTANRDSLG
jgi:hypothetical protein